VTTSYENYSIGYLSSLYFFIRLNIEKGKLSPAMYSEMALIRESMKKRNVLIMDHFKEKRDILKSQG
jgi:hypothetical protein